MTLISRLFGKKTVPGSAQAVPEVAQVKAATDKAEKQQIADILEMPDGQDLRRLAGLLEASSTTSAEIPSALERAARQRLSGLVDAGTVQLPELADQSANPAIWLAIAAGCQDAGHLNQAIASISDEATRATLVVTGTPSRVRQLAAQSIETPDLMRALIKEVRNKDKSVYRILHQKVDAVMAESRAAAERTSAALALCESIERHSQGPLAAGYAETCHELERRWHSLVLNSPEDLAELSIRVVRAAAQCQSALEAQQRHAAEEAARHDAEALARVAAEQVTAEAQLRAEQTAAIAAAEAARVEDAAKSALAAQDAAAAVRRENAQNLLREVESLVREAEEALASGATQRAASLRRTIDNKLGAQAQAAPPLVRQLQQLDARLREFKQWKEFAVAPKRAELIAAMESLIGSNDAPQAIAKSIKDLQQEWRTATKGIGTDMSGEAARFQRASQAAYQPCREWFEKQSRERQANLVHRQDILARLQAFDQTVSGESVEWRVVAQVLREATQEWRRHWPVDRESGRQVQQEFDVALQQLQAKLDTWHAANVADKQQLVRRAQHLLSSADHRAAIESAKRLQTEWKASGPAPREQEQRLWADFRQACDAVFQKSEQVRADANAAVEEQRLAAQALCEDAERVASDTEIPAVAAVTKATALSVAFEQLPELPAAIARGLTARLAQALKACQARASEQRVKDSERSIADLMEADRRINAFEWAGRHRVDEAPLSTLKERATSFIATVGRWPPGSLPAIQKSLARAEREESFDAGMNEGALRSLCVRGEILSGSTTPPEDETLRREFQMHRLVQSMGQGSTAVHSDWEALVLEWVAAAAVAPEIYDKLQSRFLQARSRRPIPPAQTTHSSALRLGRTDDRPGAKPTGRSERGGRHAMRRH